LRRLLPVLCLLAFAAAALAAGGVNLATVVTNDGHHPFRVEIAATPGQQARGLMYRQEMAADAGMLFLFPDDRVLSFWMKNTLIPLDMLFLAADGRIVHIHPRAEPLSLTPIRSPGPARAVLEINGGLSQRLGIRAGDRVEHPAFRRGG
jgi:hypothetical protein